MPYIKRETRALLDLTNLQRATNKATSTGELNFQITRLCDEFCRGLNGGEIRYAAVNAVIGVMECVKLEFYRRIVGPYENSKEIENGDVYYK